MCVGPIVGKRETVESVKPKFKVGDKVRVTSKRSGASFHLHDRICTILRMSDNAEAAVLVEEGPGGGGVWLDEIELVTEEPKVKPKFKVGDKIRRTAPDDKCNIGDVYTVKSIDVSYTEYDVITLEEFPKRARYYTTYFFELVTEEPKVKPKFKVGDQVRCINDEDVRDVIQRGKIYTVTDVYDNDRLLINDNCLLAQRFELVSTTGTNPTDEDLFQIIKDAQLAYKTLSEKKVLESDSTGTYRICHGEFHKVNFRLLTKPSLEPFKLPDSGYQVSLRGRGDVLDIGCKKYNLDTVQTALLTLLVYNESTAQVGVSVFQASKNGVKEGGSFLSWTDAETLYSKIKDLK